mmetsp:Transcript_28732/g.44128  ORF Transcript_28732/g.44128 Transcript_28732/m.44128 type:complete len:307 (+) Transcript_28732:27-947(+)
MAINIRCILLATVISFTSDFAHSFVAKVNQKAQLVHHNARSNSVVLQTEVTKDISRDQPASQQYIEPSLVSRKGFLNKASLFLFGATSLPLVANAGYGDGTDLTEQLFNPDGSVKEGVATEAKFQTIRVGMDPNDSGVYIVDGKDAKGTQAQLSYSLPLKWEMNDKLYFDRSEGINSRACEQITVYQAPGKATIESLDKAPSIGIAKAIGLNSENIGKADFVSGRKTYKGDDVYYEFDLAVAPTTCNDSKEDLRLGFCPYDTIVLVSATLIDERMYVMSVECSNQQWKFANSDLKQVRSSFMVQQA